MQNLDGKIAIVTGASRGIGSYIARALAGCGMKVVVAARSLEPLEALVAELTDAGHEAVAVGADIADGADRIRLIETCEERLGPPDVLVNNAGLESAGLFHEIEPSAIANLMEVNLVSTMLLTHAVLQGMVARRRGHICNVASLAGKVAIRAQGAYSASKSGLVGFTHALRLDYCDTGVSASVVCPGFVSDAGMWADAQSETGIETPYLLGASSPQQVAGAVVKAIRKDLPEVIVSPRPMRPLLVIGAAFPRFSAWLVRKTANDVFYRMAERRRAARSPGSSRTH